MYLATDCFSTTHSLVTEQIFSLEVFSSLPSLSSSKFKKWIFIWPRVCYIFILLLWNTMSKKESLQLIEVLVVVYIVMSRLEIGIICSEKNIEHFSKKYYMFQMAVSNKKSRNRKTWLIAERTILITRVLVARVRLELQGAKMI